MAAPKQLNVADDQECKRLAQMITENKRFILCFGQNKNGELGMGNTVET